MASTSRTAFVGPAPAGTGRRWERKSQANVAFQPRPSAGAGAGRVRTRAYELAPPWTRPGGGKGHSGGSRSGRRQDVPKMAAGPGPWDFLHFGGGGSEDNRGPFDAVPP